ncbi:Zinc finger, AN1-type [Sesbania bispinosa]|nr:Zinc finger, AN1-type [Sesbania bispinosa]
MASGVQKLSQIWVNTANTVIATSSISFLSPATVANRSYKSHACPKSDHNSRKVVVCEACSMSIETTGHVGQVEEAILERHHKSGKCDPNKKKKTHLPCEAMQGSFDFSNNSSCKTCHMKVCLKHRFPADHACSRGASASSSSSSANGRWNNRFLAALASRNGQDCSKSAGSRSTSTSSTPSVKAC